MTASNPTLQLVIVGLFLAAHILVPLGCGDVYPFTSAPMFRDKPEQYCNYRILAPDGTELPQEDWLVQRVYDGNPVGYGVGVTPPAVIEQKFGIVHDEHSVREHIRRQFLNQSATVGESLSFVEVVQESFGPVQDGTIEKVELRRWKVASPSTASN
ncbi:MAG: hypothetical protein ACKVP0_09875 [Pirellulaceae bacterium]